MLILQNLTQLTQIHGRVSVFDFINYDAYCKFKLGILMNISNINIATFDAKQNGGDNHWTTHKKYKFNNLQLSVIQQSIVNVSDFGQLTLLQLPGRAAYLSRSSEIL